MKTKQNWPELDFLAMQDTIETLHQWIQIVGKIRLRTMPWQNHSWHCTFYVSPSGFSTHGIPYEGRIFQVDFDFQKHQLFIRNSDGEDAVMEMYPRTVADFHAELFEKLSGLGIKVNIHPRPNEMDPSIPFAENTINKSYDPKAANALWMAMLRVNEVFHQFRSRFIGKTSPVHLFWGAFDLAVTRFSGKTAPLHPGGIPNMSLEVMQEAYSHEVSSVGFWPGSKETPIPAFYSYAYPGDPAFKAQKILPAASFYSDELGEFLLKYEDVRNSGSPDQTLLDFLQSTYEAAANTSKWDRHQLERS